MVQSFLSRVQAAANCGREIVTSAKQLVHAGFEKEEKEEEEEDREITISVGTLLAIIITSLFVGMVKFKVFFVLKIYSMCYFFFRLL